MNMFYYIDKNGRHKKYVGNVIDNNDGTYSGILTKQVKRIEKVELTHNDSNERVVDTKVEFSYNGKAFEKLNKLKQDENGSYFFETKEKIKFDLKFNEEVLPKTYFTYTINNVSYTYTGTPLWNKVTKSYVGSIPL